MSKFLELLLLSFILDYYVSLLFLKEFDPLMKLSYIFSIDEVIIFFLQHGHWLLHVFPISLLTFPFNPYTIEFTNPVSVMQTL